MNFRQIWIFCFLRQIDGVNFTVCFCYCSGLLGDDDNFIEIFVKRRCVDTVSFNLGLR